MSVAPLHLILIRVSCGYSAVARDFFLQAASKLPDVAVAVTSSSEVADHYGVSKKGRMQGDESLEC